MKKITNLVSLVSLVIAIIALFTPVAVKNLDLGGSTSDVWSAASFQISGTEVISSSRGLSVTTISGTTGTLSSTLAVSGASSLETLTQGGGVHATTSAVTMSAYTLVASEMDTENVFEWENNLDITLTLPATSTLSAIVPNSGDVRQYYFQNASTTAAATITFAAGTGIDLQYAEATGGDLVLNGLDWAKLTFIRQSNTDITIIFDEMTEAD